MWIIQSNALVELPNDVPIPSGSHAVEVPEGFTAAPEHFRIEDGRVVEVPVAERRLRRNETPPLTPDEIATVRRAIAEGRL